MAWPVLGLAVVAVAAEESYSLDDLVRRPPFGATTKPTVGAAVKVEKDRYELRGFFGRGPEMMVSVRDNSNGESLWLKFTDKTAKWRLLTAEGSSGKASVEIDGRIFDLKLGKTDGLPLPVVAGGTPAMPSANHVPLYRGADVPSVVGPTKIAQDAAGSPPSNPGVTVTPESNAPGNHSAPPISSPEKPAGRP